MKDKMFLKIFTNIKLTNENMLFTAVQHIFVAIFK